MGANEGERPLYRRSGEEKRQKVKEVLVERPDLKYWQIGKELELSSAAVKKHAFLLGKTGEVPRRRPRLTKEAPPESEKLKE